MNEIEVTELIAHELRGEPESKIDWDFKPLLVQPPERAVFAATNGVAWPMWVVLREREDGYVIGFDDEDRSFHLVSGNTVVSSCSSMLDAIAGM